MTKKIFISALISLSILSLCSCERKSNIVTIDINKVEKIKKNDAPSKTNHLRVSLGGIITTKKGLLYYQQLLSYLEKKINRPIKLINSDNYAEINKNLAANEIDLAFICGGPYVDAHDKYGIELLVAPQMYGKTTYQSYIIVSSDSPIKTLKDLRGKTFAFTDPLSNTGKLIPNYMLLKIGETPESFFGNYIYTYAHDKSIKIVALNLIDAAAVNSLIWKYVQQIEPEITAKTKIITESAAYGIPPIVVSSYLDPELKEKLKSILLNIHKDIAGEKILRPMRIDKFVTVEDSAYNSIRAIKSSIDKQEIKK